MMKGVSFTGPLTPENDGGAIKERKPRTTSSKVPTRLGVPA